MLRLGSPPSAVCIGHVRFEVLRASVATLRISIVGQGVYGGLFIRLTAATRGSMVR